MRTAYLDAFSGVSGDMLLGAFLHAGVPADLLRETLAGLDVGATLEIEEVDRGGIHALKASVLVHGSSAETHTAGQPAHLELDHGGRTLDSIRHLIGHAGLPAPVREMSIHTFELLGAAEAKVHHVPIEEIHFHEVGAVDAIADIVLASAAAHALEIGSWHCSPLNVGGGTVHCAHGRFPVPAPATAELLRGAPTYSSGVDLELVTPTGAALVRAFGCNFGAQPALRVSTIGYGAGSRNPEGMANVVRLSIGEAQANSAAADTVLVLEAAIDDLNPQILAFVTEQALAAGALDVMCTPVFMKKNRPGTLITILANPGSLPRLEELLLRETSTLGLRIHEERRVCLERRHVQVATEWGQVRIKVGHRDSTVYHAAPEFEDCRALAEAKGVPLKRVMEAALQAYRQESP